VRMPPGWDGIETTHQIWSHDPEVQVVGALPLDEWDQWNERRDRDLEHSQSRQYVSKDIYGVEDLDNNGRWVADPEYGNVWSPYATAGWAPYRNGRWVWEDYYGWTWVSYDPWGWAPYHYGSWFYRASFGWCWYPGERYGRHYWSPARVAFFGLGGGGVNVGFGRVGWVPLGPHEPYYRGYGRGVYGGYRNGGYRDRSINIQNNVNITNVYRNARVYDGITAVDHNNFGRGRVSYNNRVSVDDLNRASLVRGQLPVAPGRESLRMSDREVRSVRPATDRAQFSSRRQPAQVDRIPFEEQRRGMEQASRRVVGSPAVGSPAVERQSGRVPASVDNGWRKFGEPARTQSEAFRAQENRPSSPSRNGWRNLNEVPQGRGISESRIETPRSDSRNYQRIDSAPRQQQERVQRYQPAPMETPRVESPRSRGDNAGSIRISPPIVRERAPERTFERSAPRSEQRSPESRGNGGGSGAGNGGGRGEGRGNGASRSDSSGGRGGRGR